MAGEDRGRMPWGQEPWDWLELTVAFAVASACCLLPHLVAEIACQSGWRLPPLISDK